MLCGKCKKNQATKTYETVKNGEKRMEYFCLECYQKQFVYVEEGETLSSCPYCGTTVAQFKRSTLVGCAHCYQTLSHAVFPVITKMQGGERHQGKSAYAKGVDKKTLRLNELEMLAKKHYSENDDKTAAKYDEKIDILRTHDGEDAIWHSPLLSKQP